MSKSPFQRVTDDLSDGCGCACHTGLGYRTACEHCWPLDPSLLVLTDDRAHAHDCRCERCRPDILRLPSFPKDSCD